MDYRPTSPKHGFPQGPTAAQLTRLGQKIPTIVRALPQCDKGPAAPTARPQRRHSGGCGLGLALEAQKLIALADHQDKAALHS